MLVTAAPAGIEKHFVEAFYPAAELTNLRF
jgi:hypothetical protein